jgi:hypothetical protein
MLRHGERASPRARALMLVVAAALFVALTAGCESKFVTTTEGALQWGRLEELAEASETRFRLCSDREFFRTWVQADVSVARETSGGVSVAARFSDADDSDSAATFSIPPGGGAAFKSWLLEHTVPGKTVDGRRYCTDWVDFQLGPATSATEGRVSWRLIARGEFYYDGFRRPHVVIEYDPRSTSSTMR